MVNEVYEVKQYLNGENISKKNLFRICYMLAKWYHEQGLTQLEIRDKIFLWGKENNIYIKYNVNNDIISKIYRYNPPKLKSVEVKINAQDIENINRRFDNRKTKMVALAILCYAKVHSDKYNHFNISSMHLSFWLNMNRRGLRQRYIRELIDYEFITEFSYNKPKCFKTWDVAFEEQSTRYQLIVPSENTGEFILQGNNVKKLYTEIFDTHV